MKYKILWVIYAMLSGTMLVFSISAFCVQDWVSQGDGNEEWRASLFYVTQDEFAGWEGDSFSQVLDKEWEFDPDGPIWDTFRDLDTAMIFFTSYEIFSLLILLAHFTAVYTNRFSILTLLLLISSVLMHALAVLLWHMVAYAMYNVSWEKLSDEGARAVLWPQTGPSLTVTGCIIGLVNIACFLYLRKRVPEEKQPEGLPFSDISFPIEKTGEPKLSTRTNQMSTGVDGEVTPRSSDIN